MHSVKEANMLAMKIDLLLKKFEDYYQDKAQMQTLQGLEIRMTCEVYGMLDIRATIAKKPKKKLYSSMAAMDFVHKEVRGGINHAHTTKEVTGIRILLVLTSLA